jgi:enoyl-CoA hydratase/carnithine racemase
MDDNAPLLTVNGPVATLTLRRPAQANRLEPDDLAVLCDHIAQVNQQPQVLVLQLRAGGKYFCSGYDISRIGAGRSVAFDQMVDTVEDARPVTIAALQGGVYGGATDLALACDFRVGVQGMDMFMPAARLGLHFYESGLRRYATRLGLDNAKRLFLTAQKIDAAEMQRIGFLTHLVAPDRLDAEVQALTEACASMAPLALLGMKRHLNAMARGTLDREALHADMRRAYESDDLREGQAAWAAKRAPQFKGR